MVVLTLLMFKSVLAWEGTQSAATRAKLELVIVVEFSFPTFSFALSEKAKNPISAINTILFMSIILFRLKN